MYALIFENKVVDISTIKFDTIPDMFWVEFDNSINVKIGYFYIDDQFKITDKSDDEYLIELKQNKLHQIEGDYLKANLENKLHEGKIIHGEGIGKIRQFKFKQKYNNSIPALDSDRFLLICINSNKPLPYETEAKEGDKVVVQIKPEKAREILDHMIYRYQLNYAIFSVLKTKINFCKNPDEVNKIVWDPSVITQDQLAQINKLLNS